MPNPSYWVFKRRAKWYSGWRDNLGRCRSKAHSPGAGKALASEYARRMAMEACQVRAGIAIEGTDIRSALEAFLKREDVKHCTHALNQRHLEALISHFGLRQVGDLTDRLVHEWLGHLKSRGCNPGGQSLSLRILRTFCRFCRKKRWLSVYPFDDFHMPKSTFVGRYLSNEERAKLLSVDPRYEVDQHLHRALTFGLYSLLRISQVFNVDWEHFRVPDQLWVPGIKGQDGRWITLHPSAVAAMGQRREVGRVFDYWESLPSFREAVYKKVRRERLRGVRFHETKHTGISAMLEAGFSIPEVSRISGNSYRTIAHYAHVNERRVFEKWKAFDYPAESAGADEKCTADVQQDEAKMGPKRDATAPKAAQGGNAKRIQFATSSQPQTSEN